MKKILQILLFVMIFVVSGCTAFEDKPVITADMRGGSIPVEKPADKPADKPANKPAVKPAPEQIDSSKENKPVVISFAGDCTLGSFLGSDYAFEEYWQYGAEYYLGNVKKFFAADDITFVNLEGPLTKYPQTAVKEFPMRGDPKYVEILTSSSVEICNLSNNHIYDCGDIGFQDTVNLLKSYNVKFCGEGYSDIIDVRGMKIGFLGYQAWYDSDDLRAQIYDGIKNLHEQGAQVVIVEFHWGDEKAYVSDPYQDAIAHFTIDSGADIVVGAHPHVMQGIEVYNGKIIAYSLGNFCFGANNNPSDKETFILQTTLTRDGDKISITPHIIPCRISSTNSYNDFCPTPVTGYEAEQILNHLADSSKGYARTINFGN
ncbi:MAG: CapA family protein [Selenomonadaceae bacterium]|nr:CapA family protein [Selenomonadaceae bacterium]